MFWKALNCLQYHLYRTLIAVPGCSYKSMTNQKNTAFVIVAFPLSYVENFDDSQIMLQLYYTAWAPIV